VDTSLNGPAEVGQLSDASAITSGTGFSCALSTSNGAVCWGASLKGQLGVTISNTGGRRHIPQLVDGLRSDVVSIAAGVSHACAVKTDGNVWCWGTATQGSLVGYLGNVVSTFSELPVRVRIESGGAPDYVTDAVAVSARAEFIAGVPIATEKWETQQQDPLTIQMSAQEAERRGRFRF
jgi:hypothetical protein